MAGCHHGDPRPPANPAKAPTTPLSVTFENVTYAHPGDTQPTLHNLTFSLHPGQTIALVGPSGSGKTTLANLLLARPHASPDEVESACRTAQLHNCAHCLRIESS
ncbi:MAG: hypothetical protein OHK0052_07470 [Anaerolineales bacterium]